MNSEEFLEHIKPELQHKGIRLSIRDLKKFAGWFSAEDKELLVSTSSPLFFQVALHEYCHFLQWTQYNQFWTVGSSACGRFFDWLNGSNRIKKLDDALLKVVSLERHCESLALSLIGELDLDINKDLYLSMANTYLFSYYYVRKYRKWSTGIYDTGITRLMPSKLLEPEEYLDVNNLAVNCQKIFESKFSKT